MVFELHSEDEKKHPSDFEGCERVEIARSANFVNDTDIDDDIHLTRGDRYEHG
jgi:hypothetical protein